MSRIERIRARWEKATPGPWRAINDGWGWCVEFYSRPGVKYRSPMAERDAQAIAHAPDHIDYLLRIAEAAKAVPYPVVNRHDDTEPAEWEKNLRRALQNIEENA